MSYPPTPSPQRSTPTAVVVAIGCVGTVVVAFVWLASCGAIIEATGPAPEATVTETASVESTVTEEVTVEATVTAVETVTERPPSGSGSSGSSGGSSGSGGSVYYRNCDAARAAGTAPVRTGDPGYGSHLDRDGDGVGCE